MNRGSYLPSAQFTLLVVSLVASVGLVYAAQLFTHSAPPQIAVAPNPSTDNSNWEAAFDAIEAEQASSTYAAPNPEIVGSMLAAAQSPNLTDTIGRSLMVNLGSAESQGLGDDIPTQDQLVAQAAAAVEQNEATTTAYTLSDLQTLPASATSLHDYGNAVISTMNQYPDASEQATFLAVDEIVEGGDKSQSATLREIGTAYASMARALLQIAVPQTLAPLQLEIVNNYMQISATYDDMQVVGTDSVRGLQGLQTYNSLMQENSLVFTQIAQDLNSDGILFNKDEPGNSWGIFLSQS